MSEFPETAPSESQIAATLAEHANWSVLRESPKWWICSCGKRVDDDLSGRNIVARHQKHVAAVLTTLFAGRDAEQRRDAVEEVADAIEEHCRLSHTEGPTCTCFVASKLARGEALRMSPRESDFAALRARVERVRERGDRDERPAIHVDPDTLAALLDAAEEAEQHQEEADDYRFQAAHSGQWQAMCEKAEAERDAARSAMVALKNRVRIEYDDAVSQGHNLEARAYKIVLALADEIHPPPTTRAALLRDARILQEALEALENFLMSANRGLESDPIGNHMLDQKGTKK